DTRLNSERRAALNRRIRRGRHVVTLLPRKDSHHTGSYRGTAERTVTEPEIRVIEREGVSLCLSNHLLGVQVNLVVVTFSSQAMLQSCHSAHVVNEPLVPPDTDRRAVVTREDLPSDGLGDV